MKLTKLIALSFVTCSGVLALSPMVQAADGASLDTNGTIGFIESTDNGPVSPVDPIDPDLPIVPENPENPGTAGPLSIDYISRIRFGDENEAGSKSVTYFADLTKATDSEGEEVERPNFIQVTDNRGTNAGWKLTVKQDKQFMNGTNELTGSKLTFEQGTLNTPDDGLAPKMNAPLTLTPGTASPVITAAKDQGTGTWVGMFADDKFDGTEGISLEVPGTAKKVEGNYTAKLTWVLTDSPA